MARKKIDVGKEIEIPEGIDISIENNEVHVKGKEGEIKKRFPRFLIIEKKENKIIISSSKKTKREKKQVNTAAAHIQNMIAGAKEKYQYKLQVCSVHFPMNVKIEGDTLIIKNFLGESKERKVNISQGVDVRVEKDIIVVESIDKEAAGQTAANIEKKAKIKTKDKRIFQDGIFIIEKAGRIM